MRTFLDLRRHRSSGYIYLTALAEGKNGGSVVPHCDIIKNCNNDSREESFEGGKFIYFS